MLLYIWKEKVILFWVHQFKMYILLYAMIRIKLVEEPRKNAI